jgi:hypothetical protein
VLSSFIGGFLFGWLDRFEHDQPTRTVRPPTPQKISRKILYVIEFAAVRVQGLSRLAAATRQGLALIGPSTAARLFSREERRAGCPISNRRFSSIFAPLLTARTLETLIFFL